jgi:hypothetical protein
MNTLSMPCSDCGASDLVEEAEDTELVYLRCGSCRGVTCATHEDLKFWRFTDALPVPFARDWVLYDGETWVATVDYMKSFRCHRPVVDLAYCLTHDQTLRTVNWDPKRFQPHPRLSDWKHQPAIP